MKKLNYALLIMFAFVGMLHAQEKTVTGTIADEFGVPLPGASVLIKGTSTGAASDFDGKYSIQVNENNILVISFIGYSEQELSVEGKTVINVTMQGTSQLDEIIVVGYGTQKKSDLTGAIASIKAKDFSPGANYNVAQLLNGSAAGVSVSQVSSAPGAGLKVQIRGAGSINSSNDVLYVVDGVPGISTNSINPDDIESIEVLKDASSASIYGTRAANGVVLITTKKGKAGKLSLSYNVYTGFQSNAKKLDLLKASDYMRLINLRSGSATYSDQEIASAGVGTDWQDEIFRDATVQNHSFSASGGGDKGTYFIGLNYFDQDGIVNNSSYEKYNARINVQSKPLDNLKLSTNISVTHSDRQAILFSNLTNEAAGPINAAIQYDPTILPGFDVDGQYFRNSTIALDNPLALNDGYSNVSLGTNINGVVQADYEFVKNVTATTRFGIDLRNFRTDVYRNRLTLNAFDRGSASVGTSEYMHWLAEYLIRYENTFNEKHDISVIAGTTFEKFTTRGLGASSSNFLSDVLGTDRLQNGDGEDGDSVSSNKSVNQLHGIIGRLNYGFDNKYLFTASVRIDGSSRFSNKNKYAVFPSGSLAWRLGKEQFLENTDWLNELKLRIGYGKLGNQAVGNFLTRNTLVGGVDVVANNAVEQGVVPARLPNPDLKWETTEEINVGLDYAFFNNRITGSIDYFNRKTKDQLFFKPLPAAVGFTGVWVNFGEVENKGLDILVSSKNINTKNFSWTTTANVSILKNEVVKLPDFTQQIIGGSLGGFISGYTIVKEGSPLRSFYGYEIDGIFQEGDDIANSPTPTTAGNSYAAGMPRFVDQNDDGVINAEDRVILGDPFADVTFGINNRITYKNLSLDFFINGVQGIKTIDGNVTESIYPTNDARNAISKYFLNQWTPENPSNSLPSLANSNLYGGGLAVNSLTITDASFIRLKNITLGYNVPNIERLGISALRLYVAADNLFTITNYDGYDPDASSAGTNSVTRQTYNSYPLARTFRLGLNVKF